MTMCTKYTVCGRKHRSKYRRNYKGQFDKDRRLTKYFLIAFGVYAVSMIGVNTIWGWAKSLEKTFVVENSLAEVEWHQPTWQEEVLLMVKDAGLDVELAKRLVQHESHWKPDNSNPNKDGTLDRGLWMINDYWHPEVSDECAYDWFCSTREAIRIQKSRGWGEWVAYRHV